MPTAAPKSSGAYPGDSGRRLRLRVRPGPLDPETGDVRGVDHLAWAIRDDRHVTRIVARRDVQDLPEPDSHDPTEQVYPLWRQHCWMLPRGHRAEDSAVVSSSPKTEVRDDRLRPAYRLAMHSAGAAIATDHTLSAIRQRPQRDERPVRGGSRTDQLGLRVQVPGQNTSPEAIGSLNRDSNTEYPANTPRRPERNGRPKRALGRLASLAAHAGRATVAA